MTKRTNITQKPLYHYTVGQYLPAIIESEEIRPATALIANGEKPAVWFSTNPVWEQTCNKLWQDSTGRIRGLNNRQTMEKCGGLVRIQIAPEAAPYTWQDF